MDGADKGLLDLDGRPVVARLVERLKPQVCRVLISANRNLATYAEWADAVLPDAPDLDFAGPLAGMSAALDTLPASDWLLVVPCDTPALPHDLGARLLAAAQASSVPVAMARSAGPPARLQPTHCLLQARLATSLALALRNGERRVQGWLCGQAHAVVDFDDARAFDNLNSPTDWAQLGHPA
jgi:molybdopterin-guanine dinucleotide biosynthesis protein A